MAKEGKILLITLLLSMAGLAALALYRTEGADMGEVGRLLEQQARETLQEGFLADGLFRRGSSSLESIKKQLEDRRTRFEFDLELQGSPADFQKEAERIFDEIFASDLYLKYIVKNLKYGFIGDSRSGKVTVTAEYWETPEESAYVRQEVRRILRQIVAPAMNDHEKVKAIHDFLVLNLRYDTTLAEHSAYGALVKGKAVCQGYAMLAYDMLKEAGIPVMIVEGRAGRGTSWEDHGWNLVRLDGRWFHLDATWDDPTPDQEGRVLYNYYNLTDWELAADHQWDRNRYPRSDVTYYELLKQKMTSDPGNRAVYGRLMDQLDLRLLETPERTAAARGDLERIFRKSLGQRAGELSFLYLPEERRLEGEVNEILQRIGREYDLRSWRFTHEPYLRTPQNDWLVHIRFTYRQ